MCRQQSRKLFGKEVYVESDLKPNYYSAIKQNDKYGTHLFKCKLNKTGKGAVRVWNKGGVYPGTCPRHGRVYTYKRGLC